MDDDSSERQDSPIRPRCSNRNRRVAKPIRGPDVGRDWGLNLESGAFTSAGRWEYTRKKDRSSIYGFRSPLEAQRRMLVLVLDSNLNSDSSGV